jgi:hypothetical protein
MAFACSKMSADASHSHLATRLRAAAGKLSQFNVTVGFDGFVDEIISVVHERHGLDQWTPVKEIDTFGSLIRAAAGRSSLREIVVHRADPGGCSVNLGDGLLALGVALDCFATLGQPRHAAFDSFAGKCRSCHSWGREPGRTLAFEFSDGKLMFSAVTQLAEFDCYLLEKVLADGAYARACAQAQLIALTDWTLYPHMTDCWRKLQREVFAHLTHRPFFFLDLVDPTSRSEADIQAMIAVIPGFEVFGPTVLGLNGTEANVLARILGLAAVKEDLAAVQAQATALRQKLGISQVVIHCVKLAARADALGTWGIWGPFCANPRKSTGAGDRFNAGYCAGLMLGFSPEDCLLLGGAASGFFVRQAQSASTAQLAEFIEAWGKNELA